MADSEAASGTRSGPRGRAALRERATRAGCWATCRQPHEGRDAGRQAGRQAGWLAGSEGLFVGVGLDGGEKMRRRSVYPSLLPARPHPGPSQHTHRPVTAMGVEAPPSRHGVIPLPSLRLVGGSHPPPIITAVVLSHGIPASLRPVRSRHLCIRTPLLYTQAPTPHLDAQRGPASMCTRAGTCVSARRRRTPERAAPPKGQPAPSRCPGPRRGPAPTPPPAAPQRRSAAAPGAVSGRPCVMRTRNSTSPAQWAGRGHVAATLGDHTRHVPAAAPPRSSARVGKQTRCARASRGD